jgi:hypothetical protein
LFEQTGHALGLRREGLRVDLADQVMGGIALHIQVDYQGAIAHGSTDSRQVTGDAGLADPAFLIKNNASHK